MPVAGSRTGTGAPARAGVAGVSTVAVTVAGLTGEPFNVSFASASTADGLPAAPPIGPALSLFATSGLVVTAIVTANESMSQSAAQLSRTVVELVTRAKEQVALPAGPQLPAAILQQATQVPA